MSMEKTLGGDRLGSGKKMKVELHGYERSTHDMGYIWRSTMSAGTLVPFLCEIALPGDTFDIDLDVDIKTHPTIGPLFGSYKTQLDIFQAPIRLYNSLLHNNMLGIGLDMSKVKLPKIQLTAKPFGRDSDYDNSQINPSALLSYLGIRGVGKTSESRARNFNGTALLAYWEIYKNYYANKQEGIGAFINGNIAAIPETIVSMVQYNDTDTFTIPQSPTVGSAPYFIDGSYLTITYSGSAPNLDLTYVNLTDRFGRISLNELMYNIVDNGSTQIIGYIKEEYWGVTRARNYVYQANNEPIKKEPIVDTFDLDNIDNMRKAILAYSSESTSFIVNDTGAKPYGRYGAVENGVNVDLISQQGIGLKTYQSDLFNNWLETEWIGAISTASAVSTAGGSFTIDQLNLSKKVYDLLNRVAVSGGSYDDWLDAVWTHERARRAESPIYCGGLVRELVFQEVVSNTETVEQPLGTLAGKGVMGGKSKGGKVVVKVDEPSYIIGIISLTPRVDYSQGNKWDVNLDTMNDLHKPALDQIGFQDLITEQMAWWTTEHDGTAWVQKSAGKQPAWINYMTNVNQTKGNFAILDNEMFMTLNRRYEYNAGEIADLTTYIDPSKYNFIFAQSSLDAQNFWAQIGIDMTVRRKMSAKVMPNL